MKRIKSGLSLVIAVVMCLSLLPMTVLAVEEWEIIYGAVTKYNGPGGHVVIPDNITAFNGSAFSGNTSITSIVLNDNIESIPNNAFGDCTNLTSVTIGSGVTSMGEGAFRNCTSLTDITIPGNVRNVGFWAFIDCTNLTNVTIEKSTMTGDSAGRVNTSIFTSAFRGCNNLENVTILEDNVSIHLGAFHNFSDTYNPNSNVTKPSDFTPLPKVTIHGVAGSSVERYAKDYDIPFVPIGGTDPTDPPKTDNAPNLDNASGWARDFINEAYNNGLIPSTLQSTYTQATTRAEFCALAVTLYEKIKGTTITDRKTFDDTTDINVEKAAAIGVVSGVGNNKFDPNAKLTREQAAVMLARLAEAVGKPLAKQDATFADNSKIATWAIVQVGQIQAAGIMSGTGNNMFSPQDPYTREQSITTINRLYGVLK